MESLTVQADWVQPLTGYTEAREDLMLKIVLKVMWRFGIERGIESRAFSSRLGLFPLQEASHLQQLTTLGTISGYEKDLPGQSSQNSRYAFIF